MNSKTAATIAAIFIAAATGVAGDNLLPNGNFDLVDKGQPRHWDKDDKLTSFWISEPGRGTILKLDSRVDRNQALAWWDTLKKNPLATPPIPIIPQKPLQSVGANEGTFIDSDTIPVTPGQNYKLSVDYKGPVQPFVWIKGFMLHPVRNILIDSYQTRLVPDQGDPNTWRSFSIGFNPTARTPRTSIIKVRVYAYWPAAVNYFDNIRIEAISDAEMSELTARRHSGSSKSIPEK